jgi:hypothetical protein
MSRLLKIMFPMLNAHGDGKMGGAMGMLVLKIFIFLVHFKEESLEN